MTTRAMQGVFPILITPFDEAGRVDEESLRRLVEFNINAGVHGLGVALGSEIFKLSEAERDQVTRSCRQPGASTDSCCHQYRCARNRFGCAV